MNFNIKKYTTLSCINSTKELRLLPKKKLSNLCDELRSYLIDSVSYSSGHLASGLGVIELTVALHYVYNTPFDQLIWDVGHQAYPHKILTGRRDKIRTIRQKGGIHSFPWRNESEYDVLSVGHSSTSISASVGIAVAASKEKKERKTVCIIGDGAITAGMAFEAINHAGDIKPNMVVILNDNKMSISKSVGALNTRLSQLFFDKLSSSNLNKEKEKTFSKTIIIKKFLKRIHRYTRSIVKTNTIFEELGFNYIGPIDGHNVVMLTQKLREIKALTGPQFLHIVTKKGYGYEPAEKDPITFHAVSKFDLRKKYLSKNKSIKTPSYSKIFGDWLCEIASKDEKLIAITPAMPEGAGMVEFSKKYPNQYFDVAIAEQHAVTFSAGLAIGGFKPIVAIYSTFLQRAYDQVIHDVAIQKLPVLFAIDRAGIVGEDGKTHQGAFDISYLRCIPDIVIMTPSDENEFRQMLYTGYHYQLGPSAVRYPRGNTLGIKLQPLKKIPIGKSSIKRQGKKIAILNFGVLLSEAEKAANSLNATLVDMRFAKPLDESMILKMANTHEVLVTLEENAIIGGAGSGTNEFLMAKRNLIPVLNLGLPDYFIPQGTQDEIRKEIGLDSIGIENRIRYWLLEKISKKE